MPRLILFGYDTVSVVDYTYMVQQGIVLLKMYAFKNIHYYGHQTSGFLLSVFASLEIGSVSFYLFSSSCGFSVRLTSNKKEKRKKKKTSLKAIKEAE